MLTPDNVLKRLSLLDPFSPEVVKGIYLGSKEDGRGLSRVGRGGVLKEPGELTKEVGGERRNGEGLSLGPVVEGEEGGEGGRVREGTKKERERGGERRRRRRGWLR